MVLGAGSPIERIGIDVVAQTGEFYKQVDKAVNKGTSKFAGLAANVGKAMVAAGAVAGAAIVGVGVASTKMALDFEASIAEVKTLLPDLSEKGFNKIKDDVLDLSKEMGITTDEMVPALYQAISAGVPPENVIDFLRVGAKASIGGVTDLATAVDGLSTVVNAFGYDAEETGRVADVMFTAVKLGKTTMAELSTSMFQAAPLAAALGLDIEDVAAATATLTKSGTPTSVAMTQIRQAMVALSKPTADMVPLLEATGYESGEALLQAEGFAGALGLLTEAADGNKQVLAKAFGSVEALQAVLGLTGENAEVAASDLAAMMDATGAADKAFETMANTAKFKLGKFLNLLRVEMTKLGLVILPLLTKALDWAIELFEKGLPVLKTFAEYIGFIIKEGDWLNDSLSELPKPLQKAAKAFGQVLSVVTAFVKLLTSRRTQRDVTAFVRSLRNLPIPLRSLALFAMRAYFALKPLVGVARDLAVMLLDLALSVAGDVWDDFVSVLTFLLDNVLGPLAETALDFVASIFGVGSAMGENEKTMERVKDILVLFVEAWLALLLARKTVTLTQNIVHTGATFITKVASWGHTITQNIKRVGAFFYDVTKIAQVWTQVITQQIKRTGALFLTPVKDWTIKIKQFVTKIETKKITVTRTGIEIGIVLMKGIIQGMGIAAGLALAPAIAALGISAVGVAAVAIAAALVAALVLALLFPEQAGMLAGGLLGLFVKAMIDVTTKLIPFLVTWPLTLFEPVLESLENWFNKTFGPDLEALLKDIIELDLGGVVENGLKVLYDLFVALPVAIAEGLVTGFGDIFDEFKALFSDITGLSAVELGKIGKIFTDAFDAVTTFFDEWARDFLAGFTESLVEVSGVSGEKWKEIGGKITGAAGDVITWFKEDFFPFFTEDIPAFFKGVGEAIPKALGEGLTGFKGYVTGPLNAIITAFEKAVNFILGGISKLGSVTAPFADAINAILGFFGGPSIPTIGDLGRLDFGRLAAGGPLAAGEWAQVNERGMEFFRPYSSGTVLPTAPAGVGAGGSRLTNYGRIINVYGPGRQSKDVIRDLDRMVN